MRRDWEWVTTLRHPTITVPRTADLPEDCHGLVCRTYQRTRSSPGGAGAWGVSNGQKRTTGGGAQK